NQTGVPGSAREKAKSTISSLPSDPRVDERYVRNRGEGVMAFVIDLGGGWDKRDLAVPVTTGLADPILRSTTEGEIL
ncbi:MAG: hypothetical protein ABEH61_05640, partial [Haloarculaceae archaeon]